MKVGTLKKIIETTETETNFQPSVSFLSQAVGLFSAAFHERLSGEDGF